MRDTIFVLATLVFFVLSVLYVKFCGGVTQLNLERQHK